MILDSNLISIDRQWISFNSPNNEMPFIITGVPIPLTGFKNPGRQGPIQVCIFVSESVNWGIRFNIYQSNSPDGPWKRCATRTVHAPRRGRFLAWRFLPRSVKKQWIYFEAVTDPENKEWPELPNASTEEEVIQGTQVFAAVTIEDLRWYEDGMFIDWRGTSSGTTTTPDTETPPESLPEIEESEEDGVRLLVIKPATEEEEEDEEIEDFEVEELEEEEEEEEHEELEEKEECAESSGVYRGLVITKSEAEGSDSDESIEELEVEDSCQRPFGWYILCNGWICEDTICGTIIMGECPWLCLDNSYVCCSGSCGT
ncbi:MAG: hypothetical protein LUJ25_05475, partial [Firmicutes bacterium]|nr:hypothetical protein [Bacillota bacterium]